MMHVIKTGFKQSEIKDKRQIKQKIGFKTSARRNVDHSHTLWYSFYYNSRMFLVDHVLQCSTICRIFFRNGIEFSKYQNLKIF